jgi:hypothetical protein
MSLIRCHLIYTCKLCQMEFDVSEMFFHLITVHHFSAEEAHELLEQTRIEGGIEICL